MTEKSLAFCVGRIEIRPNILVVGNRDKIAYYNSFQIIEDLYYDTWLPLQISICLFIAHVNSPKNHQCLDFNLLKEAIIILWKII